MLKVAVVILTFMLAYAGIYSLMGIFVPELMLMRTLKTISGKTTDDARDDGYLRFLSGMTRAFGLFALVIVIAGFFTLFAAVRKAQKWAWWALLIGGSITWLWAVIHCIVFVDKLIILLMAIGMLTFLAGLLLPVKEFFARSDKNGRL